MASVKFLTKPSDRERCSRKRSCAPSGLPASIASTIDLWPRTTSRILPGTADRPPEPVDVTVVYAADVRAGQSVDAMAVVYVLTTLVWLLIALRFVDPNQVVTRAKREAAR